MNLIKKGLYRLQFLQEYLYNCLLYLFYKLKIKKWKYHEIALDNGIKYKVREAPFTKIGSDQKVIDEVWKQAIYPFKLAKTNDKAIVLDIGAHIGIFSVFIAATTSNVIVYSYEPLPDNFELLTHNVKINSLQDKIKTYNLAISDANKKINLYVDYQNSGGHSAERPVGKPIIIDAVSLEKVFKDNNIENCNLLKMDIEGSEYPVLYRTPPQVFEKIEKIYLEHHAVKFKDNYNSESLRFFLEKQGYRAEIKGSYIYAEKSKSNF